MKKTLLVISSPSGGGKSTVVNYILKNYHIFSFSISATTRKQRPNEIDGKHYYFLTKEDFNSKIEKDEFVEYEELFGNIYGTPKSEITRAIKDQRCLLFDIDVKGALSIKKAYPEESLLIFLTPKDESVLLARLQRRGTESVEQIANRMERARMEIELSEKFDKIIVNDVLENTFYEIDKILQSSFL